MSDKQPAQAGQVLTRDELHDMRNEARADVACMDELWWILFARAIEQAVLAKRVPMTARRVTYTCPACHFSLERQE